MEGFLRNYRYHRRFLMERCRSLPWFQKRLARYYRGMRCRLPSERLSAHAYRWSLGPCLLLCRPKRSRHVHRNLEIQMESLLCLLHRLRLHVPARCSHRYWRSYVHQVQRNLRKVHEKNICLGWRIHLDHVWWLLHDILPLDRLFLHHVGLRRLRQLASSPWQEREVNIPQYLSINSFRLFLARRLQNKLKLTRLWTNFHIHSSSSLLKVIRKIFVSPLHVIIK